jgi:uncharacterized DUF497 family protein
VDFEWNPAKARRNRQKHGISFQEAATVFGDPLSLTYPDPDHSTFEQRFITVGLSSGNRVFIIAHTDHGDTTPIISARKATRGEQKFYEEKG